MDAKPHTGFVESSLDDIMSVEPAHHGVKIHSEDAEYLLDESFELGSYVASSELLNSSLPFETTALTHEDLIPWESPSLTSANSPSSCATFSTAASRSSSTSLHLVNRDYILALVDPGYTTPHDGNMKHIQKHPDTFQCTLCPKRFTRAYNLRTHLRTHGVERLFVCAICGEGFVRHVDRKRHEALHSGERRFVCMGDLNQGGQWGCGRRYSHVTALARHFYTDVGRFCIQPLFDQEEIKPLDRGFWDLNREQNSYSIDYRQPPLNQNETPTLPAALLAQYPTLSTVDWPVNFHPMDKILPLESRSPHDKDSSLCLDKFNPESYGKSDEGNRLATDHGINQTDIDRRHLPPRSEDTNPQPAGQERAEQLDHVQKPLINFTNVKDPICEIQDVSIVASSVYDQDHVEDTVKRNGENLFYPLLVNQEFEQEPFSQRSPASSFSSTKRNKLGKASPYSSYNLESESDSCLELETEMSSDDCSNVLSPSPSIFSIFESLTPKRMLMADVLRSFWDIYNKDTSSIISRCIALVMKDVTNGENTAAASTPSSSSASPTSASMTAPSSWTIPTQSGTKRRLSEDGLLPNGDGRRPLKPNDGKSTIVKDQLASRYACPFRKHNPRKYNMHRHQRCALGSFGSIARIKEHLYRKHMAPVQCVRCWLFFSDQDQLNIHISATKVCERRDGQAAEGITPSIERRLRSRKKSSSDETDEDRWRQIYRMLFPAVADEDMPSPYYESIHDDAAQGYDALDIPIEEFMRQEVPRIFSTRLQTEVSNMNLEESGLLDNPARLRQEFITRMTSLISEAQEAAATAYQQRSSGNNLQLNQLMTPEQSSRSGSFPASSEEPKRNSYQSEDSVQQTSWSKGFQSASHVSSTSGHDAVQDYLKVQKAQVETTNLNIDAESSLPTTWVPASGESDSYVSRPEPNSDADWFSGRSSFTLQDDPETDSSLALAAVENWDAWLNNNSA